ncbi:hypothetical protein CYLTODRAFT_453477 [Cylindrobasidium torrendii FP15055 ss-10]|uniref:F-box domain-containing protein n=1 Tax=Cylindrobasidium torrendii FP15055 ss-10 TaxID=1314674 RepID=A0A0D7BFV0_9AGAR|nr:hypothetical protein CYLTODRAFT_453477 [Cylindrobasidium torrendii FP15055 ss-10]
MPHSSMALPAELIIEIIIQLSCLDDMTGNLLHILALRQTCRLWDDVIVTSKAIWLAIFAARYDIHEYHYRSDFDLQRAVMQRTAALKQKLINLPLLRDMVLESVVHNIPAIVRSPIGSTVRRFYYVNTQDVCAPEYFLIMQAVMSATPENRRLPAEPEHRRQWLSLYRRGSFANTSLRAGGSYRYYQYIHISMLDLLKFDPRILPNRQEDIHASHSVPESRSVLETPPPNTRITGRMLGVTEERPLPDVLRSLETAYLESTFDRFYGVHTWVGYYADKGSLNPMARAELMLAPDPCPTHAWKLTGGGVDMPGLFVIRGTVKDTGEFALVELFDNGVERSYQGWVLPYGLVGEHSSGVFWMWKEDCDDA